MSDDAPEVVSPARGDRGDGGGDRAGRQSGGDGGGDRAGRQSGGDGGGDRAKRQGEYGPKGAKATPCAAEAEGAAILLAAALVKHPPKA